MYKITFTAQAAVRPVAGPVEKHPELETLRVVGAETVDRQQIPYTDSDGLVLISGGYSWTELAETIKWNEKVGTYQIITTEGKKIAFAPNRGLSMIITDADGAEVEADEVDEEDDEEEVAPKKKPAAKGKATPAKKTSKRADPDDEDDGDDEGADDGDEDEDDEPPARKPGKKAVPAKKSSKRADPEEDDEGDDEGEGDEEDDEEEVAPKKKPAAKGKAKAAKDEDEFDWEE